jgi:hypothetical protein
VLHGAAAEVRMRVQGLIVAFVFVSGCYTDYLKKTAQFASATDTAGDALSGLSALPMQLCRQEAQLNYLQQRVALPKPTLPPVLDHSLTQFNDYYAKHDIGGTTWKKTCDGYAPVGESIDNAIAALRAYGQALAAIAGGSYDGSDTKDLTDAIVNGAASLSSSAKSYQNALSGLGGVLAQLGGIIEQAWVASKVDHVVSDVNPHLQKVAAKFDEVVKILHDQQLFAVRV